MLQEADGGDESEESDEDEAEDGAARRARIRRLRAQFSLAGIGGSRADGDDDDVVISGHSLGEKAYWDGVRAGVADALGAFGRGAELTTGDCARWLGDQQSSLGDSDDFPRRAVEPDQLNRGQRFLFEVLKFHDDRQRNDPEATPCRIIVPGKAGVGKSFALDAFVHYLRTRHGAEVGKEIVICAYTGVASLLIGGTTLHRAFNLPANGVFADLTDSTKIRELQEKLRAARWVFLDERSMVGLEIFGMMAKRTAQARESGSTRPFRDLNIVMFGDNGQIPPVGDKPLFSAYAGSDACKAAGRMAYLSFSHVIPLDQQMRSAEDAQHMAALDRLHDANTTRADWLLFKSRSLHAGNANIPPSEQQEFMGNALWLYSNNADAVAHNDLKLRQLGKPVAFMKAKTTGRVASIRDHAWKGGGMYRDLYLCEGARVMLRRNLWLSKGLVNGSLGRVVAIVYDPDEENPGHGGLPLGVICTFHSYTGPPYLPGTEKSVFVPVVTATFDENNDTYTRTQIPLIPGWAITIHKSQGMTIGEGSHISTRVVIDIGKKEIGSGMSYVAFSRAKKRENYAVRFPIFELGRITRIKTHEQFKARVAEDRRLEQLASATRAEFARFIPADTYTPRAFE